MKKMNKNLKLFLKLIVGLLIVVLLFLYYKIGLRELYETILQINLFFLGMSLILFLISYLLSALTLKILASFFDGKISFWKIFEFNMRSYSIGLFSPGRIGEFSFLYFLKKNGLDYGKGGVIFFIDKMITFTTISAISIFGILILVKEINPTFMLLTALAIPIGLIVFVYAVVSNKGRDLIKKYFLKKHAQYLMGFSSNLAEIVKKRFHFLVLNLVITIGRWTLGALIVYLLFIAFGNHVDFMKVWLINPLIILVSIVPISIAGLGIREGSAVVLYGFVGVHASITLEVYFLITAINYLVGSCVNLYYLFRK